MPSINPVRNPRGDLNTPRGSFPTGNLGPAERGGDIISNGIKQGGNKADNEERPPLESETSESADEQDVQDEKAYNINDTEISASQQSFAKKAARFFSLILNIFKKTLHSTSDFERQLIFSLNPKKWPTLKQLKHCGRIFSKTERRIITVCLIVTVSSAVWLGSYRLAARLTAVPFRGGSYTEAMIGQPKYINPVFSPSAAIDTDITRLVFSGLLKYGDNLQIEPDLASDYSISADGRAYTATLRDELYWHDGYPLTIDDAIFTFASIADPDVKSPLRSSFRNIVVEKIDEKTIRFTLKDPYRGFADLLTIGLIPQHIWGDIPRDQWRNRLENLQPIGSGPWQFNNLQRDSAGSIKIYVLNAKRTNGAESDSPAPLLDSLAFKFFPDETQALNALVSQNAEGMAMLSAADKSQLKGGKHLDYYEFKIRGNTAIFFNLNNSSPVQDIAVRRALKNGIDKKRLVLEIVPGEAAAASGWFSDGSKTPGEAKNANAETSDDLLAKAGWEKIGAIRRNKKGETLNITLTVIDREPDRRVGQFIQEEWRRLGVETRIDLISPPSPANVQRAVLRPRAYDALLYTVAFGATYDPYPFWHSSQRVDPGLNFSLFSNHEADGAIERGRRAVNDDERNQAFAELQKIIATEAPAIALFTPIRFYAISDSVKGFDINEIASPADRFNNINNWYVKTKWRLKW